MGHSRCICSRATLLARRFSPSFTYICHYKTGESSSERRYFGNSLGVGNGVRGQRNMSTCVDKVDYLTDAPVLSEVAIAASDSAAPVAALQYLIDGVHSFTGFSWAASIALSTLMIRGATIPVLIDQLKSTYKVSIMRPHLEAIKEEMNAKGNDRIAMLEGKQKMDALFREYGLTPFAPLKAMVIQGPIFISFFLAISNMAEKVPSFKNGGAFWFTDLTTPDAMYILPVLTALSILITVEFNLREGLEGNPMAGTMKTFSRGLAVLTVPFTMSFPKAVFCYWVTSNIFSFAYGCVLKRPVVKKALGIPEMPPLPPAKIRPGAQCVFSLFQTLKQAGVRRSSAVISAATGQPKRANDRKATSSAGLSQRLKSLERQLKQRKRNNRL